MMLQLLEVSIITKALNGFTRDLVFSCPHTALRLWPLGFFLRAKLRFDSRFSGPDSDRVTFSMYRFLTQHVRAIEGPWLGLPELTNANGAHCPFSCETQVYCSPLPLTLFPALSSRSIGMVYGNSA